MIGGGNDPMWGVSLVPGATVILVQSESALDRDKGAIGRDDGAWFWLDFGYVRDSSHGARTWNVEIPMWLFVLISAAAAVWAFARIPRKVPGHCAKCGYDLRATPERCPECGTVRVAE
jgi:hypothetical protein